MGELKINHNGSVQGVLELYSIADMAMEMSFSFDLTIIHIVRLCHCLNRMSAEGLGLLLCRTFCIINTYRLLSLPLLKVHNDDDDVGDL